MNARFLTAAAILLLAVPAGVGRAGLERQAAPAAIQLQQVIGERERLQIVLGADGASAVDTNGKQRTGVVVDYRERTVAPLDYAKQRYFIQRIDAAAAALRTERTQIAKMEIEVPDPNGNHNPGIDFPNLVPLDQKAEIAGLPARAYALRQKGTKASVRLWLADGLPAPPEVLQEQMTGTISLPLTAGHALLRSEALVGGKWVTGLDTVSAKEIETTEGMFAPPKGWTRIAPPKTRTVSSVPALPLRWFGPVSANPDVFVLYWNGPFAAGFGGVTNTLVSSMVGSAAVSPYWSPLGQYGVGRGRFIGSSGITFPLPSNVGTWNFFAVEAMVTAAYFTTAAPKIWWRVFARDPIIAIMAPAAALAAGGWGGYHMVNLSAGAFLPWPASLAAHPEMPWLIVRSTGLPDGTTTTTLSHELVEAASDPLPLSANIDYTKSPPWTGGEIADICSVGPTFPPSSTVFRFGATLARYWSNTARACVG